MPVQNSYSGRVSSATGPDATAHSLRTLDFLWSIQFAHPLEERAIQLPGGPCCLGGTCGDEQQSRRTLRSAERGRAQLEIVPIHTIARWKSGFPLVVFAKRVNCETQRTSPSMSLTFFFHIVPEASSEKTFRASLELWCRGFELHHADRHQPVS